MPPVDPRRLQAGGSLFLTRPTLAHYIADREELLERSAAVFDAVVDGSLRVRIGGRYALDEVGPAHADLESRRTTGKLLRHPLTRRRTPPASSAASVPAARAAAASEPASSTARTNADPTMTPSAYPATSAAWSALDTPSPTPTGRSVTRRTRATSPGAAAEVCARAPVTPMIDVA